MSKDEPESAQQKQQRNIKLVVEYDGSDFIGWQTQAQGVAVQQCFERAIAQMTGAKPSLRVAGRTDAGVHARAQVVTFKTTSRLSLERFAGGLNALLPRTISVHGVSEVALDFDAKRSARWKRYRYSIYQAHYPAAQCAKWSWHLISPLDLDAMRAAAVHLTGELDFEAFRAAHCQAEHARRHMLGIDITREERPPGGHLLHIVYHGNAFVRHMCRILTGTLVEVGRDERSPDSMPALIASRDRRQAGPTAPPHGLCMLEVGY